MVPVSRLGAHRLYRLAHWRWLGVDAFAIQTGTGSPRPDKSPRKTPPKRVQSGLESQTESTGTTLATAPDGAAQIIGVRSYISQKWEM